MPTYLKFSPLILLLLFMVSCGSGDPTSSPDFILAKTKLEAAIANRSKAVEKVEKEQQARGSTDSLDDFAEILNTKDRFPVEALWKKMADAYIRAGGKAQDLPYQDNIRGVTKQEYGIDL